MSVSLPQPERYPAHLRLAAGVLLVAMIGACSKQEPATPAGDATPAAGTAQPVAPPAQAVSQEVAALSADNLREKAIAAYDESRLYAPAGDNAMEYYLALRDKVPGDPGASSALTDLLPMTVIATEQSRDREDFVEAQRLYGLIAKADSDHPSLPRLKATIAAAQEAVAKRVEQQKLSAEQELARQQELEAERLRQQEQQQQQAARQLAQEQAATAERETAEKAAAQREAEQRAARQAAAREAASKPAAPPKPVIVDASDLHPISTPPPSYPREALRAGDSGEVQIEFTVGTDGSVTSARVVRSDPPRVFDREAVSAVKRWRFEPIAAPVTSRRTIAFNPGG